MELKEEKHILKVIEACAKRGVQVSKQLASIYVSYCANILAKICQ